MGEKPKVQTVELTEEQMEELVTLVSTRVVDNFYQQVGRSVIQKITTWIGMLIVAALLTFAGIKAFKAAP